MQDSLDDFIREAIADHDAGVTSPEAPTIASTARGTKGGQNLGTLPGHAMEAFIARGGMGVVYRATQHALEREVAVKVMTSQANTPELAERFRREAMVLGRLEHPNIVPIHELGTDEEGQLYYTMKLVKGRTLQAILDDLARGGADSLRQHTLTSLLTIFRKICDALAFAHSQRILHRDLKPDNIMVGEFGEVLVMDWGLAKLLGAARDSNPAQSKSKVESPLEGPPAKAGFPLPGGEAKVREGTEQAAATSPAGHCALSTEHSAAHPPQHPLPSPGSLPSTPAPHHTLQGSVLGTPRYMSPEQALGQIDELDERSDIFSLGGILYAILTLRPPVEGTTLEEVLSKVKTAEITSPSALQVTTRTRGTALAKGAVLEAKLFKPLPHIHGGRVPSALSSVVMKALRLERGRRYQTVAALSADIEAYQGGFATSAEQAGTWTQLRLLTLRHRAVSASLAVMLLLSLLFVWKVILSERKATAHAEAATANERRATSHAEATRRALGTSQVAVAEAAFRGADLPAMVRALESVPNDLRDQRWQYLHAKRDASLRPVRQPGFVTIAAVRAIPGRPAHFAFANPSGQVCIADVGSAGNLLCKFSTGILEGIKLAVSADGSRLAAAGGHHVFVHRVADGSLEKKLSFPGHPVGAVALSRDGSLLLVMDALSSPGGSLSRLVEVGTGHVRWQQPLPCDDAIFTPAGDRLLMGSSLGRLFRFVDAADGRVISQLAAYVYAMALSRDGGRLALGLYSGEVVIVDAASGAELRRARLHAGAVTALAWTAHDHLLSVGGAAGYEKPQITMRLWETEGFSSLGVFFGLQEATHAPPLDLDPGTGFLIVGGSPGRLWRLPVDLETARFTTKAEQGWGGCFISDTVLLGRGEYHLRPYDVTNPLAPRPLSPPCPHAYVLPAACWPRSLLALAKRIGEGPHSIKIYSTQTSALVERQNLPMPDWTAQMDMDPAGRRLLAVTTNGRLHLWDLESARTCLELPHLVQRAVFAGSADRMAAIVSKTRTASTVQDELTLFELPGGRALKTAVYHHRISQLAVSPDGRFLAIGGDDQTIRVLDAATLEERTVFRAHDGAVTALAFHPGQTVLASGSRDGSVKLWDHETAALRHTFLGFDRDPVMLAFSPAGRLLYVESQDHYGRLFDLSSASLPAAVSAPAPEPTPPPPLVIPADPEGWQDILTALSDEELADTGRGWVRDEGLLQSGQGVQPLPGDVAGTSYQLRLKLKELFPKEVLHLILPVGGGMVGFDLDGAPFSGHISGLVAVNGVWGEKLPGSLRGKQIQDTLPHLLEVEVRLTPPTAALTFTLDSRPLYQWSGPASSLSQIGFWRSPPGKLALGTMAPNWAILEAKVRQLKDPK